MRAARCLLPAALGLMLAASCGDDDDPYRSTLPAAEEAPLTGSAIPPWAAGYTFTLFTGDFYWFHVNPDGSVLAVVDGGDYGGDACEKVSVVDGRLMAPMLVSTELDRNARGPAPIVRTVDDRYFVHLPRGYREFQRADLCGRDVGGCGGYGKAEACNETEIASRTTRWRGCPDRLAARDGGVDAE